jgi:hypothetical protein
VASGDRLGPRLCPEWNEVIYKNIATEKQNPIFRPHGVGGDIHETRLSEMPLVRLRAELAGVYDAGA